MKKSLLICLFLSFLIMKCSVIPKSNCSDCNNKESALETANKIATKRLGKIDNHEITISEETDYYIITYVDIQALNALVKGGGISLTISKKDCKIIDYKKYK